MLDEMRRSTACFARALQRCTSRLSKHFLLTFQEVTPPSKTRNQLTGGEPVWGDHGLWRWGGQHQGATAGGDVFCPAPPASSWPGQCRGARTEPVCRRQGL